MSSSAIIGPVFAEVISVVQDFNQPSLGFLNLRKSALFESAVGSFGIGIPFLYCVSTPVKWIPPNGPLSFLSVHTDLSLWPAIHSGFYPRIHDQQIPAHVWLPDYVQTYVERDVRVLVNIGDLSTFERFLRMCAGRVGQLLNTSSLANDCGIAVDTARRWLSVLETSFVVFRLLPHHRNFNKRLVKSPKIYFHDTGLACYLLRISQPEMLPDHPLRGALFENYVMAEVAKAYAHHRRQRSMFFWRDHTGNEIDLLLDRGEELHPIEIKSGQTVATDAFKGLKKWRDWAGGAAVRGFYGNLNRKSRLFADAFG